MRTWRSGRLIVEEPEVIDAGAIIEGKGFFEVVDLF